MKKFLIALSLAFVASTVALFAKDAAFDGCTKDHVKVAISVDLDDNTPVEAEARLKAAFAAVASGFEFDRFVTSEGFYAYRAAVEDEDAQFVNRVSTPKNIGTCK